MVSASDSWTKELNDASRLADDINARILEAGSFPPSGPETQRHLSAIRRKITILRTRLDSLGSLLAKLPTKQPMTEKELHRRQDILGNLRSKANQMASALNMSNFANRDNLLGPDSKSSEINRTVGLDNHGIVGLQRQIMREHDEGLEKLEQTVLSTKHIALAVNEELDLHARLIDDLDQHVESTDSRLQGNLYYSLLIIMRLDMEAVSIPMRQAFREGVVLHALKPTFVVIKLSEFTYLEDLDILQKFVDDMLNKSAQNLLLKKTLMHERVQKRLAILSRRTKAGCSCMCLLFAVVIIVILAAVVWLLIKYL